MIASLCSLFFVLILMTNCTREEFVVGQRTDTPTLHAEEPNGPAPCEGTVQFPLDFEVLPPGEYPDYVLAVQIYPETPPPLDNPYDCYYSCDFCVTLRFPQEDVDRAGISFRYDPNRRVYIVEKDRSGGYDGHNPPIAVPQPNGPSTHILCAESADDLVVLFDFESGFPQD